MANFLVAHAYSNVWSDPEQDFQHIFMPARLSKPSGITGTIDVLWRTYALPTTLDTYQVYQIGHVNPEALGLTALVDQWSPLATVMATTNVLIQVYTTQGIFLPLATSYIMFTRDRTVILAVKTWPALADLTVEDCFFRFYSNAFFSSKRSWGQVEAVVSHFYQHTDVPAGLAFQQLYQSYLTKPGFVTLTVNGRYRDSFIPMALSVGDVLEFVYDSSVKKVVDFPIAQLQTFTSTKDAKIKYLMHYSGPQGTAEGTGAVQATIDYRDDIDVYLVLPGTNLDGSANFDGIYFHKNNDDAFRQVTHRDYSVAVPYVVTYQSSNPSWTNLSLLSLRLIIRNAGFDRPLVYDVNRIQELYRLPDQGIINAFLGIASNVVNWQAATLENSEYITLMDADTAQITLDQVESAYGYYAIGQLIAPSPILLPQNSTWMDLPPGLRSDATMYEYDVSGKLLGWYPHVLGAQYTPVYAGCQMIEGRVGPGSMTLSQVMGQNNIPLQAGLSYRYYIAPIVNGIVQTGQWKDVTGDTTKVVVINGVASWLVNQTAYQTAIRSDAQHLVYQLAMAPKDGLLQFSIQATVSYPGGAVTEVLTIPVGQLDLWLNGHALIENVDYYVTWPQVVIVNKAFLTATGAQVITVRGYGFPQANLTRLAAMETDFVRYGVISHNGVYNVHNGRVLRIVANGSVWAASQVLLAEDQIEGTIPNLPNGVPYAITQVVVPTRSYTDQDTYVMLAADQAIDQSVSTYLTEQLPDTYPVTPDIIPEKYAVYSPFASVIVHDMVNGILPMDNFMGQYSDRDIKDALKAYTYLLAYDPSQKNVDLDHIAIHPHNEIVVINLTIYQYNFLNRAVHLFLRGEVDLSKFLTVTWF